MGKGPVGRVRIWAKFLWAKFLDLHTSSGKYKFAFQNKKYFKLNYSSSCISGYAILKVMSQKDGSHGKYPVKTCCVSDELSGDMLAPSWPNLLYFFLWSGSNHMMPCYA